MGCYLDTAWEILLKDCPIQVHQNKVEFGHKTLEGKDWGAYFVYPRSDSKTASIGVITGSGLTGLKAAFANHYFQNSTHYPDVVIFNPDILNGSIQGVYCTGFFGNDWSIENGDFIWR